LNYFVSKMATYMKQNIGYYLLVGLILVLGIVMGSFTVSSLSEDQKQELLNYVESFFSNVGTVSIDSSTVFYTSVFNNLKTALAITLAGLFVISSPLIPAVIFFRGYILGFTVGFLVSEFGIRGCLFAALSIFPPNIITIPVILSLGVTGIYFAAEVIKNRRKMDGREYLNMTASYVLLNLGFCLLLILAGLIEGYISPVFIKLLSSYI